MIRLAKKEDIKDIMIIVNEIKEEMKSLGNPQWNENYPLEKDFDKDIENNNLYVYVDEKVLAFMCICKDNGEYENVLGSCNDAAYVMHRLSVSKFARKNGIASKFISYAEMLAKKENIYLMKADTEVHNVKMNALFLKLGYQFIQKFSLDGEVGEYNYYEKRIGDV